MHEITLRSYVTFIQVKIFIDSLLKYLMTVKSGV